MRVKFKYTPRGYECSFNFEGTRYSTIRKVSSEIVTSRVVEPLWVNLGEERIVCFGTNLKEPYWGMFRDTIDQISKRTFVYDTSFSVIRMCQSINVGPMGLKTEGNWIKEAMMFPPMIPDSSTPYRPPHIVPPEWYTPEGRWANSEAEYLARELICE